MSVFLSRACSNLLRQLRETHTWAKANPKTCFRRKRGSWRSGRCPTLRSTRMLLLWNQQRLNCPRHPVLTKSVVRCHINLCPGHPQNKNARHGPDWDTARELRAGSRSAPDIIPQLTHYSGQLAHIIHFPHTAQRFWSVLTSQEELSPCKRTEDANKNGIPFYSR